VHKIWTFAVVAVYSKHPEQKHNVVWHFVTGRREGSGRCVYTHGQKNYKHSFIRLSHIFTELSCSVLVFIGRLSRFCWLFSVFLLFIHTFGMKERVRWSKSDYSMVPCVVFSLLYFSDKMHVETACSFANFTGLLMTCSLCACIVYYCVPHDTEQFSTL